MGWLCLGGIGKPPTRCGADWRVIPETPFTGNSIEIFGYDLDLSYLEPYLIAGVRGDTGFKYYRITGRSEHKEPYDYSMAHEKAREHARDFVYKRRQQIRHWAPLVEGKPIIVSPYDAELFGHWWFEGPEWLKEVLRLASQEGEPVGLTTFSSYLA